MNGFVDPLLNFIWSQQRNAQSIKRFVKLLSAGATTTATITTETVSNKFTNRYYSYFNDIVVNMVVSMLLLKAYYKMTSH